MGKDQYIFLIISYNITHLIRLASNILINLRQKRHLIRVESSNHEPGMPFQLLGLPQNFYLRSSEVEDTVNASFILLYFLVGFAEAMLFWYIDLVSNTFVKNSLLFLIDFPLSLLRFCIQIITYYVNDDSL